MSISDADRKESIVQTVSVNGREMEYIRFGEDMKRLIDVVREKNKARKKTLVSLRMDQDSINIAKSFGEGYTALMSRVLYIGLRDPDILEKAL